MNNFENIEIGEIRNDIREFNNDEIVNRLRDYYYSKSFPEIIGTARKELAHSGFIAWILNGRESHNLGEYPIRKFLELVVMHSNEPLIIRYGEIYDSIIVSDYEIENINVETEKSINNVGRIDIYLDFEFEFSDKTKKIRIIIENKVGSKEHSDQTNKYFDHFEGIKEEDEINLFVFLTPISSLDLNELQEPECNCKEYIQINYQSLVDFLFAPILNKDLTEKTKFIIKEYLQSLSQPALGVEEEYKQGLIMALGTEERNLLTKFWEKNKKLILASLYAISSDPEQEKDTRDNVTNALDSLSNNKDRSLYNIIYKAEIAVEKIRKSDIGFQTIKALEANNLLTPDIIKYLKTDRSCSFQLLKSTEEITDGEIKYRRYRVNNEPELIFNENEYYVARNWGVHNVDKFIEKMSNKFEGLEYKLDT